MMKKLNLHVILALIICALSIQLYAQPTFEQDPKPSGKKWVKIENLSDEFDSDFNTSKWAINSPTWAGRQPGLFKTSQVKVEGGSLQITADTLPIEEQVDGWTHAGGLVRSLNAALPSYQGYYECRMKANQTFMSSTFWLINDKNAGTGCDVRTTEIDITENVGFNSGGAAWINNMITKMNSNTHSRNTTCTETPVGSVGGKADLGGNCYDDYFIYGAWWKSATEILFYANGKLVNTITPPADFNLDLYLRMVVETYNWNPVPPDGGMNMSDSAKTTYYDWVRSWELVDDPSFVFVTGVSVSPSILNLEVGQTSGLTETVSPSDASDKTINWSSSNKSVATVNSSGLVTATSAGSATITATTKDGEFTDEVEVNVTDNSTALNSTKQLVELKTYPNPAQNQLSITGFDKGSYSIGIFNLQGKVVKSINVEVADSLYVLDISELSQGIYILKVQNENVNNMVRFIKE